MQQDPNFQAQANPHSSLTLGDKLSMLYIKGKSNNYGLLLSSHGQTSQCFVDGVVYSVRRQVEVGNPLWTVLNTQNGASLELKDDLAMGLMRLSDFPTPKSKLFKSAAVAF